MIPVPIIDARFVYMASGQANMFRNQKKQAMSDVVVSYLVNFAVVVLVAVL